MLGGQLSEAPLDALPVFLVGLGVAGVVLLLKPGDEVLLAALDIADQRVQPCLACGPGVVVVPAGTDGKLGARPTATKRRSPRSLPGSPLPPGVGQPDSTDVAQ